MLLPDSYNERVAACFARAARPMTGMLQGSAGSPEAGAEVHFTAHLRDGRLEGVAFRAFACPHIIAACQRLVDWLEGRPLGALLEPPLDELRVEFAIPVEKSGKLLILQDALIACQQSAGGVAAHRSGREG